jgi:hypothetical protein
MSSSEDRLDNESSYRGRCIEYVSGDLDEDRDVIVHVLLFTVASWQVESVLNDINRLCM